MLAPVTFTPVGTEATQLNLCGNASQWVSNSDYWPTRIPHGSQLSYKYQMHLLQKYAHKWSLVLSPRPFVFTLVSLHGKTGLFFVIRTSRSFTNTAVLLFVAVVATPARSVHEMEAIKLIPSEFTVIWVRLSEVNGFRNFWRSSFCRDHFSGLLVFIQVPNRNRIWTNHSCIVCSVK
jgi:hypothetical protein